MGKLSTKAQKKVSKNKHRTLTAAYAKLHDSGKGIEVKDLKVEGPNTVRGTDGKAVVSYITGVELPGIRSSVSI